MWYFKCDLCGALSVTSPSGADVEEDRSLVGGPAGVLGLTGLRVTSADDTLTRPALDAAAAAATTGLSPDSKGEGGIGEEGPGLVTELSFARSPSPPPPPERDLCRAEAMVNCTPPRSVLSAGGGCLGSVSMATDERPTEDRRGDSPPALSRSSSSWVVGPPASPVSSAGPS